MDGETNEMTETVGHTYKWGIDKQTNRLEQELIIQQTNSQSSSIEIGNPGI